MTKTEYNAMQTLYQSSHAGAWQYITSNWMCKDWQPLPSEIKALLHLHPSLGICGGMLVTRTGAKGTAEFVERMNKRMATL